MSPRERHENDEPVQGEFPFHIPDIEDPEEDYDEWPYDKELDFNDPPFTPDEEYFHD